MAQVETIFKRYKARMEAYLTRIKTVCEELGAKCTEIVDCSCDEFYLSFIVLVDPDLNNELSDSNIDVSFKVLESEYCDGEPNGVNFGIDMVAVGGRIVGGFTPYNYTEKVWAKRNKPADVEERFRIIEDECCPAEAAQVLLEYIERESNSCRSISS